MPRPIPLPTRLGPTSPSLRPADLLREARAALGSGLAGLPFGPGDTTAGTETELQAAVEGQRDAVDLPLWIEGSRYFANVLKRTRSGDSPRRLASELERFLADNRGGVWENSWVRFPRWVLRPHAQDVLERDLRTDRSDPGSASRADRGRFEWTGPDGETWLRVPVSYLVKLALADATDSAAGLPALVRERGRRCLEHFLSDNTSPETFSFHVSRLTGARPGDPSARETAKRFLLTVLLVDYANEAFGLAERGQRARIYFAPHPPVRQRDLAGIVSDAFYRELFLSPCLSGWDRGEEKHRYMALCHEVLSRSQLNAVGKLREAGIVANNLVVLPVLSNTSLANNGTHASLGSLRLTGLLASGASGFGPAHEKVLGDLVVKVVEHFLPLFVGTYSAAPYRLGFSDFHPERALGFLAHELDFTHLRMLWRRWRKKADLTVLGRAVSPFGPPWLDRAASAVLGFRGDWVPDLRLVDYPVSLLSTDESPALDGRLGNTERLKRDLTDLGVFDTHLSLYLPYRQREFARMGFSGFEGRHYSVFGSLREDLGRALELQALVTAFAFREALRGDVDHAAIPDLPSAESERRQVFFDAAIGIPTFFVRHDTTNRFLRRILSRVRGLRASRRYQGYLRVPLAEYRYALVGLLREEAPDLVEALGAGPVLDDVTLRLAEPAGGAVAGGLNQGILAELGVQSDADAALRVDARTYNEAAERYYRGTLRRRHTFEALALLAEELRSQRRDDSEARRAALRDLVGNRDAAEVMERLTREVATEEVSVSDLRRLIGLLLLTLDRDVEISRADLSRRPTTLNKEDTLVRHAS